MTTALQIEPPLYSYLTPDGPPVYDSPVDPPLHPPKCPPLQPPLHPPQSASTALPVYTSGGGTLGSGAEPGAAKATFVIDQRELGREPAMTTCTHCQQQVMTNISFKAGQFAWIICTMIIVFGLLMCLVPMVLLPIPFCAKRCKDVHHTCPLCDRVLHVSQRRCCEEP
ncbi:cell death-inducing p53-target protein 1-like [Epinephelus moara]|uniref:cell death-inducing p53-target protein 1-like n=1 Tax=Epinephelus moara TaxID=300413 RepID=UPI00214EB8DC|nr:cell death-inducing p53-target protein 1-like [Epinephelus moara]